MHLIGLLPTDSTRASTRLDSLGILHVTLYIISSLHAVGIELTEWTVYPMIAAIAALYSLLITLPFYLYLLTRERWLLVVQVFALASHTTFALLVVAPYWISFMPHWSGSP